MYFKDKRLSPLQRDYNYFINEFEGKIASLFLIDLKGALEEEN